jgi:hypothetical protein
MLERHTPWEVECEVKAAITANCLPVDRWMADYSGGYTSPGAASGGVDEGYWETAYDDSGNPYYYHTVTMETTWVNPYDSRTCGCAQG